MSENDTLTDAEARAEDQARVGGGPIAANDAVERRAVGNHLVHDRRAQPDAAAPRAESRGVYRDTDGDRRIVGAGDVIPDGWERIESATVADRVGTVQTNLEDTSGLETSGGGSSTDAGGSSGGGSSETIAPGVKVSDYDAANAENTAKLVSAAPLETAEAVLKYEKAHKDRSTVTAAAEKRIAELKDSSSSS